MSKREISLRLQGGTRVISLSERSEQLVLYTRVEVGLNTSTVVPASRKRRRRGNSLKWDSKVRISVSSAGPRPKNDCSGKDQKQLYSKLQIRPLVRGRYKLTNPQLSKENLKERKYWSRVPDGFPAPRQTGRLSVGSKLTWNAWVGTVNVN
jgi:hypothetical protein